VLEESELELESLEGVGAVTRQKLEEAGIYSLKELAVSSPVEVAETLGWEVGRAAELINSARKKLAELGLLEADFVKASEVYKRRLSIERISTGSKALDELLGGGIETQAVTEFYGEYGTGKTQICHTLAVTVQLPKEEGGLQAGALYVDTENTFRPERVASIAEARGLDAQKVLDRIIVARAYNSAHQEFIVKQAGKVLTEQNIRLLVVDSAVSHYRAEFVGRATLAERQQLLNRFMHLLLRTAEVYNVAVVVTNQVQAAPDVFFGDPTRPTGGHVLGHTSTYRIYLRKGAKGSRIARMVDSPYHPEREAAFILSERGIEDLQEIGKRAK
jgi:DNA repair protein RadA